MDGTNAIGGGEVAPEDVAWLDERIASVADHPEPGVTFRDIAPLLVADGGLGAAVQALVALCPEDEIDLVAGVEARGFVLGTGLALALGVGFLPIRKPGRLPGEVLSESYDLEYGSGSLELRADLVEPGERVLVVDDILATGGTVRAACDLVRRAGASLVGAAVLLEIAGLGGRAALTAADVDVVAVIG